MLSMNSPMHAWCEKRSTWLLLFFENGFNHCYILYVVIIVDWSCSVKLFFSVQLAFDADSPVL